MMSQFLRLLKEEGKAHALMTACKNWRSGISDYRIFSVEPEAFDAVPGKPFGYWVSNAVRETFRKLSPFEGEGRTIRQGLATSDDYRFVRSWWEIKKAQNKWFAFAKGGAYSPFYADLYLVVDWAADGEEIKAEICRRYPYLNGNAEFVAKNTSYYFRAGLTWSDRTTSRLSPRIMPKGVVFSVKGSAGFFSGEDLSALGLMNSAAFDSLISLLLGAGDAAAKSYQVGTIGLVPYPAENKRLAEISLRAWSLKRTLDSIEETSHAFVLPAALRNRIGDYNPHTIEMELVQIQSEIDAIAFDLYGFSEDDRAAMQNGAAAGSEDDAKDFNDQSDDDSDDENGAAPIDDAAGLLSWTVGVAFGRYDWRLATAEREAPEDPEPFDPLPAKSPGMLPDGEESFHSQAGILVDDEGHPHDLPNLLEEVLQRVDAPMQVDVRRWLQREFFPFHLQRYSKSRRKAPIYWPLSTLSGSYTLWLYYPDLTSQTLFTAVNDFIEPKLQQVRGDLDSLRGKGNARSKQEEKQLEVALDLSKELADLRDALLVIAPTYSPNHNDGVQITAAPLWQLFRYKSWQKVLKDTWEKLEHGEYDWSHLSMNYWPERVLRKCHQDRSLAIAHDVVNMFWHEVEVPVKVGRKSNGETKLEWQPKNFTDNELDVLIRAKIMEKKS